MEIRIDTKKDSPEDIRKAIEFLKMLAETGMSQDTSAEAEASTTEAMVDMFGNTLADKKKTSKKDEDDDVRIIPY